MHTTALTYFLLIVPKNGSFLFFLLLFSCSLGLWYWWKLRQAKIFAHDYDHVFLGAFQKYGISLCESRLNHTVVTTKHFSSFKIRQKTHSCKLTEQGRLVDMTVATSLYGKTIVEQFEGVGATKRYAERNALDYWEFCHAALISSVLSEVPQEGVKEFLLTAQKAQYKVYIGPIAAPDNESKLPVIDPGVLSIIWEHADFFFPHRKIHWVYWEYIHYREGNCSTAIFINNTDITNKFIKKSEVVWPEYSDYFRLRQAAILVRTAMR